MVDNDPNNDEYKFAELDPVDNRPLDHSGDASYSDLSSESNSEERRNIKRNALIVLAIVLLGMLLYKLSGVFFSSRSTNQTSINTLPPSTPQTSESSVTPVTATSSTTTSNLTSSQPTISMPEQPSVIPATQSVVTNDDTDLKQKVLAMEQAQQSMSAEVSSMGQQIGTLNTSVNNLNTQINNLKEVLTNLSTQLVKQTEEISILTVHSKPKPIKKVVYHIKKPSLHYHIQAVIPGRAWLIGSNGSTLTVREGTKVLGYGTIKLIDSMQGRILTSSGQIIRFSQNDS